MKPLIVYCSRTQNTFKVATELADALAADLLPVASVTAAALEGRALVGLGSGVYWTSLDPSIYRVARQLPTGTRVFTFATSGFRHRLFVRFYRSRIRRELARCGLEALEHWHCPGHDKHFLTKPFGLSRGRPNQSDLAVARAFALRIVEVLAILPIIKLA